MTMPETFSSTGAALLGQVNPLESLLNTATLDGSVDVGGILSKLRATVGTSSGAAEKLSMLSTEVGRYPGLDSDSNVQTDQSLSGIGADSRDIGGSTPNLFRQPTIPGFSMANMPSYEVGTIDTDSLTGMADSAQLAGASAVAQNGKLQVLTPFPDRSIVKNRIIFSTVNEERRAAKNLVISNGGSGPLKITGLSFVNKESKAEADFEVASPALPFTLKPGEASALPISFVPKGVDKVATLNPNDSPTHTKHGEQYDTLIIASNDPVRPKVNVKLAGLNSANYEADNEPSVAAIARIYGFKFDVGTEDNILGSSKTPLGDEVYSPYWLQADTSRPVLLRPLAVFSGRSDNPHDFVSFKAKPGSGGNSGLIYQLAGRANDDSPDAPPNPPYEGQAVLGSNRLSGGENQKLLPKVLVRIDGKLTNSLPTNDKVDFRPTSAFALVTNGSSTNDKLNGSDQLRNWRIFPVGNPKTTTTWFAAVDPGNNSDPRTGKNFDYNDDVYLLVNARPESLATKG